MHNDWFLYHLDLPLSTKMCFPLLSSFTSRTGHRNHPIKGIKVVICRKKGVVLIRHQAREKEKTLCVGQTLSLVSARSYSSRMLISGTKVSLISLLKPMTVGIEAAGRVVLAGLCIPLCRRLDCPGHKEGEESQPNIISSFKSISSQSTDCVSV